MTDQGHGAAGGILPDPGDDEGARRLCVARIRRRRAPVPAATQQRQLRWDSAPATGR